MGPDSWLSWRSNTCRLMSSANWGGIIPVSLRSDRSTSITRGGEPPMVIPSQSAIGRSVLQFSVALPASVSLTSSSAVQSATRPELACGLGTATPLAQGVVAPPVVASAPQNGRPKSARSLSVIPRSPGGTHPVSALPARYSFSRLVRTPNSGGIGPDSWLLLRSNHCRLARVPSCGGIVPVNWLLPRLNVSRWARSPN